jgi:oligopeptide/dipeptide ABC transporter ATP-binding protein
MSFMGGELMSEKNNIVEIKDLKVDFQIRQGFVKEVIKREKKIVKAVDRVNLSIGKGEIVSLVGESGSGKTTTGRAILQLAPKTSGEILFDGKPIEAKSGAYMKAFRARAQMIFQDPYQSLNPRFTVTDIVAEPLLFDGTTYSEEEREARVIEALEFAGLKPGKDFLNRYPHELSGGQRQRVSIATCFVMSPDFIVADEPVSMLDASVRADILKLFVEMKTQKNTSLMFITHDLSLAWLISDRIAIMYLGKIVEIGSADLIAGKCMHPYSQALTSVVTVVGDRNKRKRIVLEGETPSPIDIPSGCRFHTRCPLVQERCRVESPELREISEGHFVACHFPERIE